MDDDKRNYIEPKSETILTLCKLDDDNCNTESFKIKEFIGAGTTCVVYLASYISGGLEHNCLLKEIYPSNYCGLHRDSKNGNLLFETLSGKESDEERENLAKYKEYYNEIRRKYIRAYEIQLSMGSEENHAFTSDEKMMLSLGVSSPYGLYENHCGVLYAVYNRDIGVVYNKYGTEEFPAKESLYTITDIMIQAARMVQAFHKAGYLVLDVKESNMMITGGTDNRTVMFFDFGSLVKKENLSEYSFENASIYDKISFTSSDPNLLLPPELKSIADANERNEGRLIFRRDDRCLIEHIIHKKLYGFGETTDMFLLAAIFYKRIFGVAPKADMAQADGNWEFPLKSKYIVIPELLEQLKKIFSETIIRPIRMRCSMNTFIKDLCTLRSLSFLESSEDREKITDIGGYINLTGVSKEILRTYSYKQWENLGSTTGKFHHLMSFSERYDCKVGVEDADRNFYSPEKVMEENTCAVLCGDGGMGKSTAIFDFWSKQFKKDPDSSKTCFYIDLSRYAAIRSASYKETVLYGQTAENVPVEFLTFIEVNILQAFSLFKSAVRFGAAMNDDAMSKQMTTLHNILSMETEEPEFIIFLDGYNEIFDRSDQANFEINLSEAINVWKNAAFIVTSRTFPDREDDDTIFNQIPKFKFIGIDDDEVCGVLQKYKNTDVEAIEKLKNDRLWEVLKTPMFLNMFLSVYDEGNGVSIHTRGELLDAYVIQREKKTAKRISESGKKRDWVHSDSRSFMVTYSLPFVANYLDSHRLFYMNGSQFFDNIHSGKSLYLESDILKNKFLQRYSFDNVEDAEAEHILTTETGYCIYINEDEIGFSHQYFRDYFAAKHIQNILDTAQSLDSPTFTKDDQLQFTKDYGLDYMWSDDVCKLLGEMIGDYKNEPGYTEK